MTMKSIIILLFFVSTLAAQTVTMTDDSAADSPLTFASGATFVDKVTCTIRVHNRDGRGIVAYIGETHTDHKAIFLHDHFTSVEKMPLGSDISPSGCPATAWRGT